MNEAEIVGRREAARLNEGLRRLVWMLNALLAADRDLHLGMGASGLSALESELEDIGDEARELRVLVVAVRDRIMERTP